MPVPLSVFAAGAQAMTLAEKVSAPTRPEHGIPVLKTERLTLRAPRCGDAKAIALLANDLRVSANTARIPHPYGLADAEQFIATINVGGAELCWAIVLDGALIGLCGLEPRSDDPELGYWLGASYWGRGFATEAARAVIDYAFGELGYEVLHSGARVTNPASRRVLEKCGFQWTGVRLIRIRAINSSAPADRFRLDRGLWASLKSWGQTRRTV
jgi:RimJ/RimL family protein N-acetyltransferase